MQRHASNLPVFWLAGHVTSIYEESPGKNAAILEVKKVFGRRNSEYCAALEGSVVILSADNLKKASEFSVNKKLRRIDIGKTLGHDLTEGAEVAMLCDYNAASDTPDLGLSVRAWNHKHIFEPFKKEVDRLNREHYQELEEAERRIELLGKLPVQLWLMNGVKPIVSATIANLARVFQYRAWPEGVIWKCLGRTPEGKTTFVEMPPPAMPRKPSVDIKAPDFKNPVLDELVATVQHIEPRLTITRRAEDEVMQYEQRGPIVEEGKQAPLAMIGAAFDGVKIGSGRENIIPMPEQKDAEVRKQNKAPAAPKVPRGGRKPQPIPKRKSA